MENKSLNHLISALRKYINLVVASPIQSYFMNDFQLCVLGKHLFSGENWEKEQHDAIFELTGVRLDESLPTYQFTGKRADWMDDDQWMVVRLFTDDIVDKELFHGMDEEFVEIAASDWLKHATDAFIQLKTKETKTCQPITTKQ